MWYYINPLFSLSLSISAAHDLVCSPMQRTTTHLAKTTQTTDCLTVEMKWEKNKKKKNGTKAREKIIGFLQSSWNFFALTISWPGEMVWCSDTQVDDVSPPLPPIEHTFRFWLNLTWCHLMSQQFTNQGVYLRIYATLCCRMCRFLQAYLNYGWSWLGT